MFAPSKDRWETRRWRFPWIRQDLQVVGVKTASQDASGSTIGFEARLRHGCVLAVVGTKLIEEADDQLRQLGKPRKVEE